MIQSIGLKKPDFTICK